MPTKKIGSTHKDFYDTALTYYCNEESGHNFDDLSTACLSLGVSAVGAFVAPPVSLAVGATLAAMSIGMGISAIAELIEDSMSAYQREKVISKISLEGGGMRVYTDIYEYTSPNGNNWTSWAETLFEHIG